jgi:hypothetical protein
MTCLLKITTKNSTPDNEKPEALNIGELDLDLALDIQRYVQNKAGKVDIVDLQRTVDLQVEVIIDAEAINQIKSFFRMDQYYNQYYLNCGFNFINYLAWVVITNRQHKIYREIWSVSTAVENGYKCQKYQTIGSALYADYTVDTSNYKNCIPKLDKLENFHAILNLLVHKDQHSEFMIGIVGEYLDSKGFRNDLIDLHPELYKYTSQ